MSTGGAASMPLQYAPRTPLSSPKFAFFPANFYQSFLVSSPWVWVAPRMPLECPKLPRRAFFVPLWYVDPIKGV